MRELEAGVEVLTARLNEQESHIQKVAHGLSEQMRTANRREQPVKLLAVTILVLRLTALPACLLARAAPRFDKSHRHTARRILGVEALTRFRPRKYAIKRG